MSGPFRPAPATETQIAKLRELATWPGLPQPESTDYVEKRIAERMSVNEAYQLLGTYGRRIQALGPVEAMAADAKRLAS